MTTFSPREIGSRRKRQIISRTDAGLAMAIRGIIDVHAHATLVIEP
jgi:hypothetical protein